MLKLLALPQIGLPSPAYASEPVTITERGPLTLCSFARTVGRRSLQKCIDSPAMEKGGGAIGLAISNSLLQNVFIKNLPAGPSTELIQSLRNDFSIPDSLDMATGIRIRAACMRDLPSRLAKC